MGSIQLQQGAQSERRLVRFQFRAAHIRQGFHAGTVDLPVMVKETDTVTRIVLESVQEVLLKLALQMSKDDYETRRKRQRQGVQLAQKILGTHPRHSDPRAYRGSA